MNLLLAACLSVCAADPHAEANAVYQEFQKGGVIGQKVKVTLPPPALPDGLDAAGQEKAIEALPGLRVPVEELTRNALGAPFILTLGELKTHEGGLRTRTIDVIFVAYGNLKVLADDQDKTDFTFANRDKVRILTEADLEKRQIPLAKGTRFSYAVASILDRVQMSVTNVTTQTQTDDRSCWGTRIDPRFASDGEFPNQWQDLDLKPDGTRALGPAMPYGATVSYVKCTKLKDPDGAILVEYHGIFEQPEGWFGGNDLLRSKLPIAVQRTVRSFREELKKADRPR